MDMIIADKLAKTYPTPDGREKAAVRDLSFRVKKGMIYGLLGPNGAGKTTTLRILSGLLAPTSGTAMVDGHDVIEQPIAAKRAIGFLTANTGLYQRLSVVELLVYFARLNGLDARWAKDRAIELVDVFDMGSFADHRCGVLSTGQRQRANIARALVADPPVLILDEPTLGLDVLSNRTILNFIDRQRVAGKTIILSTHYLDEAETMCDMIGLLHNGKLIVEDTIEQLRQMTGTERLSNIFLKLVGSYPDEGENQLSDDHHSSC